MSLKIRNDTTSIRLELQFCANRHTEGHVPSSGHPFHRFCLVPPVVGSRNHMNRLPFHQTQLPHALLQALQGLHTSSHLKATLAM